MPRTPRTSPDAATAFDGQVGNLIELGYPAASGLDAERFAALLAPLREAAVAATADPTNTTDATGAANTTDSTDAAGEPGDEAVTGRVPFVLVVTRSVVPIEETMPRTTLHRGRLPGFVDRSFEPGALERFVATEEVALPGHDAYLVLDVERGEEFCGAVPDDALRTIADRGRTPLTIEEGIALITHFPQVLVKNKCFSLGGSRSGDRRVPALWISQKAPKLGWCWQGNPHTWLGVASAGGRRAAAPAA
ncbi:DUF5701 family protein [Streptomyces buecherae]|uniref:Uncharacterized protein n=1 Tax=Streptomyces buecherae TaxID=2763006 RepID=A0A7H8NAB3_9ACTN|nr:DUF5701 family protein [Streptomyces buecherae]QKW51374.1 hypothetical protein HUT08_19600 [Streptomyces buecherae]